MGCPPGLLVECSPSHAGKGDLSSRRASIWPPRPLPSLLHWQQGWLCWAVDEETGGPSVTLTLRWGSPEPEVVACVGWWAKHLCPRTTTIQTTKAPEKGHSELETRWPHRAEQGLLGGGISQRKKLKGMGRHCRDNGQARAGETSCVGDSEVQLSQEQWC